MLAVVLLSLFSCSQPAGTPVQTDPTTAPSTEPVTEPVTDAPADSEEEPPKKSEKDVSKERLDALVPYGMNGLTLFVVSTDENVPNPTAQSEHLSRERWEILRDVEEKYSVKIVVDTEKPEMLKSRLLEAAAAGINYADILYYDANKLGELYSADMLLGLSDQPFFSFDSEYYYQSAIESATVNGEIYAVAGESCVDFDALSCVFVNKTRADALGLCDIAEICTEGAFTYDRLLEFSRAYEMSAEVNPNGYRPNVSDAKTNAVLSLFAGSGIAMIPKNGGEYKETSEAGSVRDALGAIHEIAYGGDFYHVITGEDIEDYIASGISPEAITQLQLFADGRGLFYHGTLGNYRDLANTSDHFMALPMPKLLSDREYSSYTGGKAMLCSIVKGCANTAESAVLIEALNARSYKSVSDAYVKNCMYKYLRDQSGVNVLRLIVKNPYFDIAVNLAEQYPAVAKRSLDVIVDFAKSGENIVNYYYSYYLNAQNELSKVSKAE